MNIEDLVLTNLKEKPELKSQTLALIEKEFGYNVGNSFEVDFYPLFNLQNFHNCYLLCDTRNQVIAHIGRKIRTFENGMTCSLWGGIAVMSKYQGQGIFKNFFRALLEEDPKENIQILWSGDPEIYYKMGFELKHEQYEYLQKNSSSQFIEINKEEISKEDFESIQLLYQKKMKKFQMFIRKEEDWQEWLEVKSAKLFVYKKFGKINAYFLKDKGQDLANIIHEHFIPEELFEQARNHGNLWAAPKEFNAKPDQISYLGLFQRDQGLNNIWINGIDSI